MGLAWQQSEVRAQRLRRVVLTVAILATVIALFAVHHRARKGRNALVKWTWALDHIERGAPIYGAGEAAPGPSAEGYPTLPFTLVVLRPFHALGQALGPRFGPRFGALGWALFSALLAWWLVASALKLARADGEGWDPRLAALVLLIAGRVLYSELQHGNLNLFVAALFALGVAGMARGRELGAGLAFGAAAVAKVTPALALVWLVCARSGRGLVGLGLGVLLTAGLVPALAFGFGTTVALTGEWWQQMVAPYLAGRELTVMQTAHINQSLLGVLARWCTDSVAIEARAGVHPEDVRVNLCALSPGEFHALHRGLALVVVLLVAQAAARHRAARGRAALGIGAAVALAMLLLSERSWKHHFVTLPLPVAFLGWAALVEGRRAARAALVVAAAAVVLTGDGLLGARGADYAEAYGSYFWAACALFAAVLRELARPPRQRTRSPGIAPGHGSST